MMNVCSAKPKVSPAASSFEKPSCASERDAHPARDEHEEEQEHGRRADQAELLRDRRVDEVGLQLRDQRRPVDRLERPLADPGAAVAAVRDRVEALDELVRVAVLAVLELAVDRAVDLARRSTAGATRSRAAGRGRACRRGASSRRRRAPSPARTYESAAGRDVEHREEDPEVEERRAEVARLDEHEHRARPRSRAAGRSPSAVPARAPRACRGDSPARKMTRKIFAISPGWNCSGPMWTQSLHAVDPLPRGRGTDGSISSTIAETPKTYL